MVAVAFEDERDSPGMRWWEPLLWEGSSCLVATVLAAAASGAWRAAGNDLLGDPLRWFGKHLVWLPRDRRHLRRRRVRHPPRRLCAGRRDLRARSLAAVCSSTRASNCCCSPACGSASSSGSRASRSGGRSANGCSRCRSTWPNRSSRSSRRSCSRTSCSTALNTISSLMQVDVERADRLLTQTRRPAALEPAGRRAPHDFAARRAEIAGAVRADHAGALRRPRRRCAWNIADDALDAAVPAMLLQPRARKRLQTWRGTQPRAGGHPHRREAPRRCAARDDPQFRRDAGRDAGRRASAFATAANGSISSTASAPASSSRRKADGVAAQLTHSLRSTRMIRVLIVDDEAPARDKLRRWLAEQADIELVGESADGLAAAAAIAKLAPDVVFLDIQMPGLSGLEVAAQLEPDARAAAGVRHRLRRTRHQGLRAECHRLSAEAL